MERLERLLAFFYKQGNQLLQLIQFTFMITGDTYSDDSLGPRPRASMDFHQWHVAPCRSSSGFMHIGGRNSQTDVSHGTALNTGAFLPLTLRQRTH